MMALPSLARALGGVVSGRQVLAPGPGHSHDDRSLAVKPSATDPDGFTVFSHCGDPWQDCKDHVRARLGLEGFRHQLRDNGTSSRRPLVSAPRPTEADNGEAGRKRWAVALWNASGNPRGTLAETYLKSRRLELPADIAGDVIRFHPAASWRDDLTGVVVGKPAMVVAMRAIDTDELQCVQVTALSPDGKKLGRKMRGLASGTAIKLDADKDVTLGLTIAEGCESALTLRQLGFRPAWALGSVVAVASFPVLDGIEALTIHREHDKTSASARAVKECGTRWHRAGREVTVLDPTQGSDANDALREIGP